MLAAGSTLGPYVIVAPLGAGGWARCTPQFPVTWTYPEGHGPVPGPRSICAKLSPAPLHIETSMAAAEWTPARRREA